MVPHTLRVAAIPAAHDYVRNVTAEARASGRVLLLDDPHPMGAPAGQWWPPVMLDAQWLRAHTPLFDLVHVHFGIESYTVGELADTVDALRSTGRALVFTVHDLENPQLVDQTRYQQQLSVLVEGADELITLTPGAANEILQRWGRESAVIPHPRVLVHQPNGSAPVGPVRIGVHLRDLRPNIAAQATVEAMIAAATELNREGRPAIVVVDINDRVRDEALRDRLSSIVHSSPLAEWNEHPRYSDAQLAVSITALDVEVLPYRHGTHSGWLELCWDLGVNVLSPDVGFYREQHRDDSVGVFSIGSQSSFARALSVLLARPRENRAALRRGRADARRAAARTIGDAQLAVYERALGRVHA